MYRTKILDNVLYLYYTSFQPKEQQGREEKAVMEVNFHLGENPVRVDNALTLDPNLVRLVKALARRAARQDFEASIEK